MPKKKGFNMKTYESTHNFSSLVVISSLASDSALIIFVQIINLKALAGKCQYFLFNK